MDFSHYSDDPVTLSVDLVNTYGWVSGTEALGTADDVQAFLAAHGGAWTEDLPDPGHEDVAPVIELRSRLREVFDAPDTDTAVQLVNGILESNGALPRLSTHGGEPHLHFEPRTSTIASWLGVVTAMGLATVIADQGLERLGVCQSETCLDVYVDTSRNRSRRHCSTTCGTREAVAAHRQRKRQQP